jgi:Ion channel
MNDRIAWLREHYSDPLLTALTVLVIVMLFVMSGSRIAVVAMLASLVMATIGGVHRITAPSPIDINLFAGSWLIMSLTLGWAVAGVVFAPGRVTYHHVMGAILLYLVIAVSFVPLLAFTGSLIPNAFSGISMQDNPALASGLIYFSFVTLTTTGYGDVFPLHPIARSLCNLEAVIGQLYPATLLARLVTLEMAQRR